MKISNKLFLYISILIVLFLAGFGYLSVQDERSHLMAETRLRVWTLSRTVGGSLNFSHLERHRQELQELVHVLSPHEASEGLSLNVYDSQGNLLDISYDHGLARVPPSSSTDMTGLTAEGQEQILDQGGHRRRSPSRGWKQHISHLAAGAALERRHRRGMGGRRRICIDETSLDRRQLPFRV